MHLKFVGPKIEIFRDFWVFVLRGMPKNENSEISEILQKRHNTVIWEWSCKSSWNAVQMTSFSKWFNPIDIHGSYFCLLKASNPSRFMKLSAFLFILVLALKKLNSDQKISSYAFEICRHKNKDFPWFPGFRFEAYTQKRKLGNLGNFTKMSWYCNMRM